MSEYAETTDPDALRTLIALDGIQVGDEIRLAEGHYRVKDAKRRFLADKHMPRTAWLTVRRVDWSDGAWPESEVYLTNNAAVPWFWASIEMVSGWRRKL